MNFVGKRYRYEQSSTITILDCLRIHYGPPGLTKDIYEIAKEYENGKIVFERKQKHKIDRQIKSQMAQFIEKVDEAVIAKYLLLRNDENYFNKIEVE